MTDIKKGKDKSIEKLNKLNKINKIKGILWSLWAEKDNPELTVHQTMDLIAKRIYKLVNLQSK
jgi:hypothetical protein